jgi:DUF1365 family protein
MMMSLVLSLLLSVVVAVGLAVFLTWLFMVIVTLCFAVATWFRQRCQQGWQRHHHHKVWRSGLFQGKVKHARFHPRHHSFAYPLYIFLMDLEEVNDLMGNYGKLWPLSHIVSFRAEDHMKHDPTLSNHTNSTVHSSKDLSEKIFQILARNEDARRQTESSNITKLMSSKTHRILLVTQLSYWGYCFNPVSFYYLQNKTTDFIDVMVAEVSNTPWGEMHHYVLRHEQPASQEEANDSSNNNKSKNARNYKFDKTFHVSPFMEMNYLYDWTFQEEITKDVVSDLDVVTSMRDTNLDRLQFTARMQVQRKTSFWSMLVFLLQYPMFCLVIQLWIHYEAFWLFVKGIPYIPHPTGSETTASRIIGTLMMPLFALQDRWKTMSKRLSSWKDAKNKVS